MHSYIKSQGKCGNFGIHHMFCYWFSHQTRVEYGLIRQASKINRQVENMNNCKIIISLVLLLSGCSNFYLDTSDLLRTQNTENLKKLTVGLRLEVAKELMGTEPSKSLFKWIDNPYRIETLKGKDGKNYEVLYYYTELKQRDDKITDDELTPLVFQDGKLIGWGYAYLDQKVPPRPVYTR